MINPHKSNLILPLYSSQIKWIGVKMVWQIGIVGCGENPKIVDKKYLIYMVSIGNYKSSTEMGICR